MTAEGRFIEPRFPDLTKYFAGYNAPPCYNDLSEQELDNMVETIGMFIDTVVFSKYPARSININIRHQETDEEICVISNAIGPAGWTDRAITMFASKYFIHDHETSVFQSVRRVLIWLCVNGIRSGHVNQNAEEGDGYPWKSYITTMAEIILEQRATFNSPVWFNVGVKHPYKEAQTSACFITKIEDDMSNILAHNVIKQLIAIGGSGSGCDLTPLRSDTDTLSTGGRPSGPCGFLEMFDNNLKAIKSSGKYRRAAGLVSLFHDHPDAWRFIRLKADEEFKGRVLEKYCPEWNDNFYAEGSFSHRTLHHQNINPAIRFRQSFWEAYEADRFYHTYNRFGNPISAIRAHSFLERVAQAAWECGDPGVQYDDNVNAWNVFLESNRRCNSTNACSELQFLDNSACNLATLRLTAYWDDSAKEFDVESFQRDIRFMITSMDLLIDFSHYPTAAIADTSYNARNLGLNFADLGELLLRMGLPYDSDEGRCVAALLASLLTSTAYDISIQLADSLGHFKWCDEEAVQLGMKRVVKQHLEFMGGFDLEDDDLADYYSDVSSLFKSYCVDGVHSHGMCYLSPTTMESLGGQWSIMFYTAQRMFRTVLKKMENGSFPRNSQVTIMVPTGTVSFALDCKTTGIEPHISHSYTKALADGGSSIDFTTDDMKTLAKNAGIMSHRLSYETAPFIRRVFQTSLGENTLTPLAHVNMMAAIQPFISMGISKTVNCPSDIEPAQLVDLYFEGWRRGLKAIAIYRDKSKLSQPLTAKTINKGGEREQGVVLHANGNTDSPVLTGLPDPSRVFSIEYPVILGGMKMYMHIGWHPHDLDHVWDIFTRIGSVGGTLDGTMATLSILVSQMIQRGHKQVVVEKLQKMTFPPNGFITWPDSATIPNEFRDITHATSIPALMGKMLELSNRFSLLKEFGVNLEDVNTREPVRINSVPPSGGVPIAMAEGKRCPQCGKLGMIKLGSGSSCWFCDKCSYSEGGCAS